VPASDLHVRLNGREAVFSAALVEVTFGRDLSCLVRLNLREVGPRHLTVRYEDGGWIAEQAGEEHDVYLDGQRVTRVSVDVPLPLRLGDPDDGPLVEVSPVGDDALSLETTDWGTTQGRVADSRAQDAATRAAGGESAPTRTRPARFRLSAGVVRLGRDPSSDLALDDLLASRRHAELRRRDDGGYDVLDLNSHNGTYVNGHRIDRVSLEELDVIVIEAIGNALKLLAARSPDSLQRVETTIDDNATIRSLLILDATSYPAPAVDTRARDRQCRPESPLTRPP
jgi:ABC transport system ATP-binding/permease protein